MVKDAARGGAVGSRGGMVSSMQSSLADSVHGSSMRGMLVDTNASVSPAQEGGANPGRGKKGIRRGSSAAVLAGPASLSQMGGQSLMSADQSPGIADDFQRVSQGSTRPRVRRDLLESIDESATGSSKDTPKQRAGRGAPSTAKNGPAPRKAAPAAMSQVVRIDPSIKTHLST